MLFCVKMHVRHDGDDNSLYRIKKLDIILLYLTITFTIRKYTFNIGYLEHFTLVLKPMLKVPMLNVSMLTSVLENRC